MSKEELISVDYEIHGRVQGVFFRKYTQVSILFFKDPFIIIIFNLMLFMLMCLFTRWTDQDFYYYEHF